MGKKTITPDKIKIDIDDIFRKIMQSKKPRMVFLSCDERSIKSVPIDGKLAQNAIDDYPDHIIGCYDIGVVGGQIEEDATYMFEHLATIRIGSSARL